MASGFLKSMKDVKCILEFLKNLTFAVSVIKLFSARLRILFCYHLETSIKYTFSSIVSVFL